MIRIKYLIISLSVAVVALLSLKSFVYCSGPLSVDRVVHIYEFLNSHVPSLCVRNKPNLAFNLGNRYLYNSDVYDIDKAWFYFSKTLKMDTKMPGTNHNLGLISFIADEKWKSLKYFETEIALSNGRTDAYWLRSRYMQALNYGFLGLLDEAAEGFEELLAVNRADLRSWAYFTDLAWVYFQQGRYEDIVEIMEDGKGIEMYPDNPWVLNMYGLGLHNLDRKEEAHNIFLKAKAGAEILGNSDWTRAYPGNDPRLAEQGLKEFREAIEANLALYEE